MNKYSQKIFVLFLCFILVGCSFFRNNTKVKEKKKVSCNINKIIDVDRIKQGGKLYVNLFKAGYKVEASENLDQIAMKIKEGISENIVDNLIQVVSSKDSDNPKLIIEGHFTEFNVDTVVKGFFHKRKKITLAVEGNLLDAKDNKILLYFSQKREVFEDEESSLIVGYFLGQSIAKSILEQIK